MPFGGFVLKLLERLVSTQPDLKIFPDCSEMLEGTFISTITAIYILCVSSDSMFSVSGALAPSLGTCISLG